ncbi:MAG: hypothetical protein WAX07_05430, partial [Candidatus Altiarchaeia archaeon]
MNETVTTGIPPGITENKTSSLNGTSTSTISSISEENTSASTTTTIRSAVSSIYGHVFDHGSGNGVPNTTVLAVCANNSPVFFKADSAGYYVLQVNCVPGSPVYLSAHSGPADICLNGSMCSPYSGGSGNASGTVSGGGYAKIDILLYPASGNASTVTNVSTTTSTTSTTTIPKSNEPDLKTDKGAYLLNESVLITVYPGNASFDLWIKEPSGWFLALQNSSGETIFVYSSGVSGSYNVKAGFFFGNESTELSSEFGIGGSDYTSTTIEIDTRASTTTTVPHTNESYSIEVLNPAVRAFPGDLVYVRFRTDGSEDLLIMPSDGTAFGTDIGNLGLFCGTENMSSDAYLVIDFLEDDITYAIVPFILLPVSFLFFLRRKRAFRVFGGGENCLDLEEQLKAYDDGMRRFADNLKAKKRTLQRLNSDTNRIKRRSGRDFVGMLFVYDEGIRKAVRSWKDVYSSIFVLAVFLSLVTLGFMGLSSSKELESSLQVYLLDGDSYYLLPSGESVNASYRVRGLLYPGYNCSDESGASYVVPAPGRYDIEYRFGNLSAAGTIDAGTSTTTCTIEPYDEGRPFGGLFENVSISSDKKEYLLNESVNVIIRAENMSFDLWIKGPLGWDLLLQNYSGDVNYAYASSVPGVFDLKAAFFSKGESRDFSYSFRIT